MTSPLKKTRKVIPIINEPSDESVISLYEAHHKIYPRSISGYFTNWRWIMVWITQTVFYGLPWLELGQRQAFLLDIDTHRFYIFGLILYPQDLIYLAVILIISALALFLFTAVAGRLWCGFSCPQTVYTKIFLWIESKVEGDRPARLKLDNANLSINKIYKKGLKHFVWISFSMWTGFTFLGYFSPIRDLTQGIMQFSLGPWETFWICFYGFATYGNAGFLREQVCKYMCPYARFQSAMFDNDTLIVTYDESRGEPRSGRSRKVDAKEKGLGDCIDCSICVQVCPVGIDIRDGLQYECISCGLCVDACNSVMDKMEYPRGLIRFSTQNGASNQWTQHQIIQKIFRPRVIIYSAILLLLCVSFTVSLNMRKSFKVDIVRDRSVLSRLTSEGNVENMYRLLITNATEKPQQYHLSASGIRGIVISSQNEFSVDAANERIVLVKVQVLDGIESGGTYPVTFEIQSLENNERLIEKSTFYIPK
jgi:cytochrome c oxidase accessory protein FixG